MEYKQSWEEYLKEEMAGAAPFLEELGFILDKEQAHIGGERFLMSRNKLVLMGRRKDAGKRVIIKVSSDPEEGREIKRERELKKTLRNLGFAYKTFLFPEEILFLKRGKYFIYATAYIEQDNPFLARPLEEQFFLALRLLETQEGFHATASSHMRKIKGKFRKSSTNESFAFDTDEYLSLFEGFKKSVIENELENEKTASVMLSAQKILFENREAIERYCGFLTHADFVPHNMRVSGKDVYLLDYTSLHFGNKYESWARFLNFMILYNRPLEKALADYVRVNRGEDEYLVLRLMRIYKLGMLLKFYTDALAKTAGNLRELSRLRVAFWTDVLQSIIDDKPLLEEKVAQYVKQRDFLRTEDEKKRQKEIGHIVSK